MRKSLLNSQLEYGHGESLIALMDVRMEGMTLTWITNLHKSCVEFGVILAGGWTAPLQRLNDIHIATSFTNNFTNITKREMRLFCECFRHLLITTLADITNATGTHLASNVRALQQPAYSLIYHFHLQPFTITRAHRRIWHIFLNAITTTNPLQLQQPLGAWISPPSTHHPFRLANGSLYVQHDDEKWYRHLLSDSQRSTRNTYRRYSTTVFHHT